MDFLSSRKLCDWGKKQIKINYEKSVQPEIKKKKIIIEIKILQVQPTVSLLDSYIFCKYNSPLKVHRLILRTTNHSLSTHQPILSTTVCLSHTPSLFYEKLFHSEHPLCFLKIKYFPFDIKIF